MRLGRQNRAWSDAYQLSGDANADRQAALALPDPLQYPSITNRIEVVHMASPRSDKNRVVTALFHDRNDAERAYNKLLDHGYRDADISVVMAEDTRTQYYGDREQRETKVGSKAAEGAGIGGAIGGTAGGIAGAIAAAAAPVVFPGIGIVLSGPLAAALAGAGAGGLGGSLIGGLIGAGIPEERVEHYESGLKEGGILLGAHPRTEGDYANAEKTFNQYGGEKVYR
jgi:hypothetical protein